jgi:hypothetical protein
MRSGKLIAIVAKFAHTIGFMLVANVTKQNPVCIKRGILRDIPRLYSLSVRADKLHSAAVFFGEKSAELVSRKRRDGDIFGVFVESHVNHGIAANAAHLVE